MKKITCKTCKGKPKWYRCWFCDSANLAGQQTPDPSGWPLVSDAMAVFPEDIPAERAAAYKKGVPTEYTMLRGIFMPGGVTPDQQQFYVDLLTKVRATPEWKEYIEQGAFNPTSMSGTAFVKWLTDAELSHRALMTEAGFLAAK